ncbi:MAG: dienelactone hydrolase family protein [Bacteroidales bacterium]|jgi:dienelactone hydrolase|nr:dienelactone hydrolase family protein [Bacteroidales bacterium]
MKSKLFLIFTIFTISIVDAQNAKLMVADYGFRADWFESKNYKNAILIILGGSQGGNSIGNSWASELNKKGYHVMSLAYFQDTGLPAQLERIPLEYMDLALNWIKSKPELKKSKIGLIGVSKGAELALLQASRLAKFDAVVVLTPSSVVWQSINHQDYFTKNSSWTLNGQPVDFLPYDYSKGYSNLFEFYNSAIDKIGDNQAVLIKVENIQAPLLLISGSDDRLWPAQRMSEMILQRLKNNNFKFPYYHINIPDAGHMLIMPSLLSINQEKDQDSILPEENMFQFLGGKKEKLIEQVNEVEYEIEKFLSTYLF